MGQNTQRPGQGYSLVRTVTVETPGKRAHGFHADEGEEIRLIRPLTARHQVAVSRHEDVFGDELPVGQADESAKPGPGGGRLLPPPKPGGRFEVVRGCKPWHHASLE